MAQKSTGIKERTVLVTGGTGYVGSALVPALAQAGYKVKVFCNMAFGNPISGENVEFIEGDLRDNIALHDAVLGCTDIIHLAAIVTDDLVDMNVKMSNDINVKATESLLGLAQMVNVKRFLYMSSSSVYGSSDHNITEDEECHPQTAYAQSKLDAERIVLSDESYLTTCAIRSATLMGPAPRMRLDTIVNIFSKQAYYDNKLQIHGGNQWRSNVHVKDVVRFYLNLLEQPHEVINGQSFNLSYKPATAIEIAFYAANTARLFSPSGEFPDIEIQSKSDDRDYRMSAEKARRILGFEAHHTIQEAVRDNFSFFELNPDFKPDDDLYYNTRRMKESMVG